MCPIYFRSILVSACSLWRCSLRGYVPYRLSCETLNVLFLLFSPNMPHQVHLPWFVHWLMLDEERNSLISSWCDFIQYIVWHSCCMTHNTKTWNKDFTHVTYFLQPLDIFSFCKHVRCSGRCLCFVLALFLTTYIREKKKGSREFLVDSFPCVNLVKRGNAGESLFLHILFFVSDMD